MHFVCQSTYTHHNCVNVNLHIVYVLIMYSYTLCILIYTFLLCAMCDVACSHCAVSLCFFMPINVHCKVVWLLYVAMCVAQITIYIYIFYRYCLLYRFLIVSFSKTMSNQCT